MANAGISPASAAEQLFSEPVLSKDTSLAGLLQDQLSMLKPFMKVQPPSVSALTV